MKKVSYSRTQPLVQKTSDQEKLETQSMFPSWLSNYAQNIEKLSVQPYRQEETSLFDQISSIMNGASKSKYSSVEDAVRDMKERSGLTAYKDKVNAENKQNIIDRNKMAEMASLAQLINRAGDVDKIEIFEMRPQIKDTFDNFIESTHGNLPIPSIIEKVKSIHRKDIADEKNWEDEKLMQYINEKNIETKRNHPDSVEDNAQLGRVHHFTEEDADLANEDMFAALNPGGAQQGSK